ncbi:hypothetical protein [Nocardioides speluncae]|uniref:hypothetical protein n=1 Tax=Nocardioides speluncae TaxID=2670337 RepID=UPI000D69341C|nr:hypothetical protein [Nocardioides speluncae]
MSDTAKSDALTASSIVAIVAAATYAGSLPDAVKISVTRYISEHPSYEHYDDPVELGKVLEELSRRVAELAD